MIAVDVHTSPQSRPCPAAPCVCHRSTLASDEASVG
jgi:hypothetical protein